MASHFKIKSADPRAVEQLQQGLGLPAFVATSLAARGITSVEKARSFFNPSLDYDWRNPYDIPGLAEVVDSLEQAIYENKRIVVFGDFDVDGVSATAVMTRGLRYLGAQSVTPFIPRRFEEGYAITPAAIERLMQYKPDLVVTVDCGISCKNEVAQLLDLGVEVLITDHHEPSDLVPENVPVCDPKLDSENPSCILAGAGVALKVIQALGARFGLPHLWREYTDLASLGTIADLMPMIDENRALVTDGIRYINQSPRPSISALLTQAQALDRKVEAHNLSFSIIPRLNASGRMGDAMLALEVLLCDDYEQACIKASQLESVNNYRREVEAELAECAIERAEEVYDGQRALVVAGEGWHEGVKGIVASRLVGMYGVPCLLFTIDGNEARGSGRSVGQINLFKAVESCSDLLSRFGGHEAAVGVTLPLENLEEFNRRLCEYMQTLPPDSFHPRLDIDACINLSEVTIETVEMLGKLAPFGQQNPMPLFLAQGITLAQPRAVGVEKNHLSCMLSDGANQVAGIMFRCREIESLLKCSSVVDAAFTLQVDEWRGRRNTKAMLKAVTPVKPCSALEACLGEDARNFVAGLYAESDEELCADCVPQDLVSSEVLLERKQMWQNLAQKDPALFMEKLTEEFIGSNALHKAQRDALEKLEQGKSLLAVLATGRGKSLIFQLHAIRQAIMQQTQSVFVYPLRALIADQEYYLNQNLLKFGLQAAILNGETSPDERMRVMEDIKSNTCNIVLTTPEYLNLHVSDFAAVGKFDFVVVDEAHHIGLAKAGSRPAYAHLGKTLEAFDSPQVLALTATADTQVAKDIMETLKLDDAIFDTTKRENLEVDDQRNLRNRDDYIANMLAFGEKTVIYTNSREAAVALARNLRKRLPHLALAIGFYHAGLSREERKRIEEMFRKGMLRVLVSTSAFGEGVNIPDIRHVILYHVPFNETEFNQMSGRAGRDGKKAVVHVLCGRADADLNKHILQTATPDHDSMAGLYRCLRAMQKESKDEYFAISEEELAKKASSSLLAPAFSSVSAACALTVFEELDLIDIQQVYYEGVLIKKARLDMQASKVQLADSVRYQEGLDEQEIFADFKTWLFKSNAKSLRERIISPIVPEAVKGGGLYATGRN